MYNKTFTSKTNTYIFLTPPTTTTTTTTTTTPPPHSPPPSPPAQTQTCKAYVKRNVLEIVDNGHKVPETMKPKHCNIYTSFYLSPVNVTTRFLPIPQLALSCLLR